jgi:hypothetical protein
MGSVTDALRLRYKRSLAFLVGAVATAGFLRHTIHVHAGISPENIREGAVLAAFVTVAILALMFFRKKPGA